MNSPSAGHRPQPDPDWLLTIDGEILAHHVATILVKNGQPEPGRVEAAIRAWRSRQFESDHADRAPETQTLAHVAAEHGLIPHFRVGVVLRGAEYAIKRRDDKAFGRRAHRLGHITRTQLDDALAFQKQLFKALYEIKRLETILIDDRLLTADQAATIWLGYEPARLARIEQSPPASESRARRQLGDDTIVPAPVAATTPSESPGERDDTDEFDPADELAEFLPPSTT